MRWDPYLLAAGDGVASVWEAITSETGGKTLFILGKGFDPRMPAGIQTLFHLNKGAGDEVLVLDMKNERDDPGNTNDLSADANFAKVLKIVNSFCTVREKQICLWEAIAGSWKRTGPEKSRGVAREVALSEFANIIVDISALPRGVFFPLISTLMRRIDEMNDPTNLHVFVAESAALDTRIIEEGLDEMGYFVPSFSAPMQVESEKPTIWFPLLAERRLEQVERVQRTIEQVSGMSGIDEVCPVLPMPAADPRQSDKLIMEYHDFLLSKWSYDPRTLLYVAEQNPFQTYRLLVQSIRQYDKALKPLGGCRAVISAHSSKLMSMGALLAAYQLKDEIDLGLANIDAATHRIDPPLGQGEAITFTPFLMSLSGVAYNV